MRELPLTLKLNLRSPRLAAALHFRRLSLGRAVKFDRNVQGGWREKEKVRDKRRSYDKLSSLAAASCVLRQKAFYINHREQSAPRPWERRSIAGGDRARDVATNKRQFPRCVCLQVRVFKCLYRNLSSC